MKLQFLKSDRVLYRHLRLHYRFTLATTAAVLVYGFVLPVHWHTVTRLLTAWDLGILFYLLLALVMICRSDNETMISRAASQDEGSIVTLVLTVCSAVASVAAIFVELTAVKGHGDYTLQHVVITGITVVLTWLFMQTMFALLYAHAYYHSHSRNNDGGLQFPGHTPLPDYWDFIYFSFVIGTAAQTADVNITSKTFRRLVTLHSVIVFFFNTTILALFINVGASLISLPS